MSHVINKDHWLALGHGGILHASTGGRWWCRKRGVHGVMELIEDSLPAVLALAPPPVEHAHGTAAVHARHQERVAVAHAAGMPPHHEWRMRAPGGNEDPVSETGAPELRALGESRFHNEFKRNGRWVRSHRPFCRVAIPAPPV